MTEGTVVARKVRSDGVGATTIIQGAGLDAEIWNENRIALVRRILPTDFQDDVNLMFFLSKCRATGLDPTAGEIWAWEAKGKLQTMTGRDGFILIARRDTEIVGLKHGLVYEADDFTAEDEGGIINVSHQMPSPRGALRECYCVARMKNGLDHIERRSLEDYRHLLNKDNWRSHPQDMLLARTIGACVRVVCPNARGVYSEADDFGEPVRAAQEVKLKTDEAAEALRARLTGPKAVAEGRRPGAVIDVDAPEEPASAAESGAVSAGMDAEVVPGKWEDQPAAMAEAAMLPKFECEHCREYDDYTGPFVGQRAWAGHCRGKAHKARVALAEADEQLGEAEAEAFDKPPADPAVFPPDSELDKPEGVTEPSERASEASEPAPEAPEGITSMDLYKEIDGLVKESRVPNDIVKQVLLDPEYSEIFAGFKRSDQLVVRPFDLNDEARLVLLKLIRGIASSD